MVTMSSQEFERDVSAAQRAASSAPVVITESGEPAFVLMSIAEYRRRFGSGNELIDRLSMDDDTDVEFTPVDPVLRVPEL